MGEREQAAENWKAAGAGDGTLASMVPSIGPGSAGGSEKGGEEGEGEKGEEEEERRELGGEEVR